MRDLVNAIVKMEEEKAKALTDRYLVEGDDPLKILDAYREAMVEVGKLFEKGTYFLPELILGGQMLKDAAEKMKPYIKGSEWGGEKLGRVLIGTVKGDIHDVGKNIVTFVLDINGYKVMDLGVDVPAQTFVDAAKDFKPHVIGLSCLLTLAYEPMKLTVEALRKEGFEGHTQIMIGGSAVNNQVRDYIGADAYGKDAIEAVRLCEQWIQGVK
jgi:5-methyltetrahydrofolate--homocysteine methyltransferase